ncbi:MAG: hypothetical protein IPG50_24985 [Myxococcales bacterium]|nr:hypothetical protein [Myxococcales bacterium]
MLAASHVLVANEAPAQDAASPRVALATEACVGTDGAPFAAAAETAKLLALELRAVVVAAQDDVTLVRVACTPPLTLLQVDDPLTRKTLLRKVDLSAFPATARARALALAAAELVAASWAEAAINPEPKVEPAGPPPPKVERETVAARVPVVATVVAPANTLGTPRKRHALSVAAAGKSVVGEINQFGGTLRYAGDLTERRLGLGVSLDLSAVQGRTRVELGGVAASVVDVAGGLHGFALVGDRWKVRGGVGLRVGSARLEGIPSTVGGAAADSVASVFSAPHGALGLLFQTESALFVEGGVEGGIILSGPVGRVVAPGRVDTVAFAGVYVAPTLGAGAAF